MIPWPFCDLCRSVARQNLYGCARCFLLGSSQFLHQALCDFAGMDFYVVLERPGYRVGRRRAAHTAVGTQHRVTKDDAIKW